MLGLLFQFWRFSLWVSEPSTPKGLLASVFRSRNGTEKDNRRSREGADQEQRSKEGAEERGAGREAVEKSREREEKEQWEVRRSREGREGAEKEQREAEKEQRKRREEAEKEQRKRREEAEKEQKQRRGCEGSQEKEPAKTTSDFAFVLFSLVLSSIHCEAAKQRTDLELLTQQSQVTE